MLKSIARFILRRELNALYAAQRHQRFLLDQWKYTARVWELYARQFVPDTAPAFDDWFMRAVPKEQRPDLGRENMS